MKKSLLRKELRHKRRELSAARQLNASHKLLECFFVHKLDQSYQHIALYWPTDGEIDPLPLAHKLIETGFNCYLPIVDQRGDNQLTFGRFDDTSELQPNRFGIPEPISSDRFPAGQLDLILLPLVGFDEKGNRLGMGKGFYDKTLANIEGEQNVPRLIGLAHECQKVDAINSDEWDILLDGILTDYRYIQVRT